MCDTGPGRPAPDGTDGIVRLMMRAEDPRHEILAPAGSCEGLWAGMLPTGVRGPSWFEASARWAAGG